MERAISSSVVGSQQAVHGRQVMREQLLCLAEAVWARALEIGEQIEITPSSFKATLIIEPEP